MHRKYSIPSIFVFLCLLILFLSYINLGLGSKWLPAHTLFFSWWKGSAEIIQNDLFILKEFRIPRLVAVVCTGIALGVSGLLMQTIFQNPLAGPYVLGISSGAGLGVALVVLGFGAVIPFAQNAAITNWLIILASLTGSFLVLMAIMAVSFRIKDIMTILILGIMFGSAASAFITLLEYFSTNDQLKAFLVWNMGTFDAISLYQLKFLVPAVIIGLVMALYSARNLDAMMLGEENAKMLGINPFRTRILVFLATGILAGTTTAFCGPIGFIGIIVPHISRMVFKSSFHRFLLPGTALTGILIMLACDILSRLHPKGILLPINSITAFVGVPFIIWIVLNNRKLKSV